MRGVDPSEALIREATARVGLDPEGRVAFKVGSAAALPYPDDFFDLVAQIDSRPSVRRDRAGAAPRRAPDPRLGRAVRAGPSATRRRACGGGSARHGIEQVEAGEAGDGSFFVGRLRGGG